MAARKLRAILGGHGEPPDDDGWEHAAPEPPPDALLAEYARDLKGRIASIASNGAMLIASKLDEWRLSYDEFRDLCVVEMAPPVGGKVSRPGELDDYHATIARHWLLTNGIDLGNEETHRALLHAAKQFARDPLKEYFRGLKWDGVERVDKWLHTHLGAADDPLTSAMGRMWLISGAARAMEPGCKVDHMLVLCGSQGDRKTSAVEALCADKNWFQPEIPDLRDKDAMQLLRGVLIACMDEMASMRKADVMEIAKNYITRRFDRYRPTYGRSVVTVPRRCIFVGTSNPRQILTDPTGNRRFWCVDVGTIDVEAVRRDRDQLWAEAYVLYQDEEPWWPTKEQSAAIDARNIDHTQHDEWQSKVEEMAALNDHLTINEVLSSMGIDLGKRAQADQNRVAKIFALLGWVRKRITVAGKQVWAYLPREARAAVGRAVAAPAPPVSAVNSRAGEQTEFGPEEYDV
jgi:putative DNA primase/helicase